MKKKLSPTALFAVVIGGVLVYALVFWFLLVSPKRAEASALKDGGCRVGDHGRERTHRRHPSE